MKIHPRHIIESEAKCALSTAIVEVEQKYELTPAELVRMLASEISSYNNYVLRYERHGNYTDKADEE